MLLIVHKKHAKCAQDISTRIYISSRDANSAQELDKFKVTYNLIIGLKGKLHFTISC